MYKLLSLPPNLVEAFHDLEHTDTAEWYCTSDPVGSKLGSGGGTTWLMRRWQADRSDIDPDRKRILLHAGGQSRRLPGYAPSGKVLTPIPVFRWERGQKLGQNLLSLQIPFYEKIMSMTPDGLNTLIASGDVYIRAEKPLQPVPQADVVCYGLWVDPVLATHHGVFVSDRQRPERLDFMLQKPSLQELENLSKTHLFLMDIGIWILSDRAMQLLAQRSRREAGAIDPALPWGDLRYYDLYSDFGRALGANPRIKDHDLNSLSVAILPLPGGEFYHYGTSRELLSSTVAVQNKVYDQRQIMHRKIKPNPALFVQNAEMGIVLSSHNENVWIENSCVSSGWTVGSRQIITGVPVNDWQIKLPDGVCVDVVPVGQSSFAVRPYGFEDAMRGALSDESTTYLGLPFPEWIKRQGIDSSLFGDGADIQTSPLFPLVDDVHHMGSVLKWMIDPQSAPEGRDIYLSAARLSADDISSQANLRRLFAQRKEFERDNWQLLSRNYERSVFYQLDLADVAEKYHRFKLEKPALLPDDAPLMQRIHNHMLRSRIDSLTSGSASADETRAFGLLRQEMMAGVAAVRQSPHLNVYSDQIVWGRSPVRIDLAGGWTDTPPYSLLNGGNVVNMAIELNGQPPLQVYVKPSAEYHIVLRSIDMGASETVTDYESLGDYSRVGSPFSIPKAALALAGFSPAYSAKTYGSLEQQLRDFGSGLEITLLSAIPAGSGLGTSSILASTVLGSLSDFCGLQWDNDEICRRTLALEQLLTTGGGWQDQYGGVLHGVKLLSTNPGFEQQPLVNWLPEQLFTGTDYRECHLLYYTGITRTAKGILAEIVRGMFLNSGSHLEILGAMKHHALEMAEAIQRNDFERFGRMIAKTWSQNMALDPGTNPPAVQDIIDRIADYTLGYKLPGAGGGGYLYMVAKDPHAAARIRQILTSAPPNPRARFVGLTLSSTGFQCSRS